MMDHTITLTLPEYVYKRLLAQTSPWRSLDEIAARVITQSYIKFILIKVQYVVNQFANRY